MASHQTNRPDVRGTFVHHMVRESLSLLLNRLRDEGKMDAIPALRRIISPDQKITPDNLPKREPNKVSQPLPRATKVCIIGSGMAGLYAALILDHLGVDYDILEAASRPGGRILTHYFSTQKHDYYDIGAMRFPKIPPMERTFDLFRRTKVELISYKLSGPKTPKHYNGITVIRRDQPVPEDDPFKVSQSNGGPVPDESVKSAGDIIERAYQPLKEQIKSGKPEAWTLFKLLDDLTLREYLRTKMNLDYHTIQWLEELESGTGLFDHAYTEGVLDSIAFDYGPEQEEWFSVEGGTNKVTEALVDMVKHKPIYNKRVTQIRLDRDAANEHEKMVVTTNYDEEPRRYDSVICTTTLACLQRIDTNHLGLSATAKVALRALRYDSATKVAIKFDRAWWIKDLGITAGGVANTDLPIRVCVYPSYNIHDDPEKPAILLCTYTWAQDATRIGSLVNLDSPRGEEELKHLMLHNLARLHSTNEKDFEKMYEMIKKSYITHHGFDWAMDDCSSGAYAFFGPGQFRALYPHLLRPHADSRFHIVGEAASANHAWIAGSVESAYRGVWMFLERHGCTDLQQKMIGQFGTIPELEAGPDGFAHILNILGQVEPTLLAHVERDEVKETTNKKENANAIVSAQEKEVQAAVNKLLGALHVLGVVPPRKV